MTRVALLWHMHQPFYQDLATREHILPWVRLHALKDYWGMVALLREFPAVRVTFNLVPSLLVQLEAFAGEDALDRHLELGMKPAEHLTDDEREFCVEQFFHAHRPRMIDPYPRYAELLARRELNGPADSSKRLAAQFTTDDLRDLQVWHKLVWVDTWYHDHDERIRDLLSRGRGFTEADKTTLRTVELELLRRVVPEYRDAADRGQVELSTSPFYHPILPLLCDSDVHFRAHPDSRVPKGRFRHPEDASEQLTRSIALHQRVFGRTPRGLWPSEGSVSDSMVPLVAHAGFDWMATDEAILERTLGRGLSRDAGGHLEQPEILYKPYRIGSMGHTVACGFRDHTLSDLIGFSYASWSADSAAADFVRRLAEAGTRYRARTGGGEGTVFVILDGENAWEHYEGQGRPFLRALYRRLTEHPELRTVTMSEACRGTSDNLSTVFPGSWINADFYIWMGHPDDHRAWGQLEEARKALESSPQGLSEEAMARAKEEILIAEGSDWFWWYGDDHSSDHDEEFDELFRRHVQNVYRSLGKPIPEELFVTNITTQPPTADLPAPTGPISPVIDGAVTSYFEWVGAAFLDVALPGGTMHQVSDHAQAITAIAFGFDFRNLFIRVEGPISMRDVLADGIAVTVRFLKPTGHQLTIRLVDGQTMADLSTRGTGVVRGESGVRAAAGDILEVQVGFHSLGLEAGDPVAFIVAIHRGAMELEHHPGRQPFELNVPGTQSISRIWTV